MDPVKFLISLAKDLKNDDAVTLESVNLSVKKDFPEVEYGKTKNYFRKFIPWAVEKIPKTKLEKALIAINNCYAVLYPNLRTLDSILTKDVRGVLSKFYGKGSKEHMMSKKLVKISYKDKANLIAENIERVRENIADSPEYNSEIVLSAIKDGILSNDPFERIMSLLLASGSRPIELIERANYFPSPQDGPNWVFQDYVAKRQTDEIGVTKPIIYFTADQFIEHLKKIRTDLHKKYKTFTDKKGELTSTITGPLNRAAKSVLRYQDKATPKTARSIYGELSYDLYESTTKRFGPSPQRPVWKNEVFGHAKDNIHTAENYTTVKLRTNKALPEEIAIKQEILEKKVESIEERLEEQNIVKEVVGVPKDSKQIGKIIKDQFELINKIYTTFIEENGKTPSQTILEKLARSVAPRSVIRLFYSGLKKTTAS